MTSQRINDAKHIKGLQHLPEAARGGVLTIGNFDGVHLGHQRILAAARELAKGSLPVVAMTFEPLPETVLRPDAAPPRITLPSQKVRLLLQCGADYVLTLQADKAMLDVPPERFIADVICRQLRAAHVVEGGNFRFGRRAQGTVETLLAAGPAAGFACHIVDPVTVELADGPARVSSTLIRRLVGEGRLDDANRCLGRAFELHEKIIPGQGVGRQIEFPTANIRPSHQLLPADGVYAGWAAMGDARFPAAISVGRKPTFGEHERVVEAFLLGASGDLYGREIALSFLHRLRDQQRFAGAAELRAQIAKDVQRVREICK